MWMVSWVCIGTRMFSPSTSLTRSVNNNYNSANRAQIRFLLLCWSKLDEFHFEIRQVILNYILFLVSIFTPSILIMYGTIVINEEGSLSLQEIPSHKQTAQKVRVAKANLYHLNNILRVSKPMQFEETIQPKRSHVDHSQSIIALLLH